jgi:hypothetical protein
MTNATGEFRSSRVTSLSLRYADTPTLPAPLPLPTDRDVGRFDQGRDAIAYLEFHISYRACRDDGGHLADGGLDDDFTEHLIRDDLLHLAGYFVPNRLFHITSVRFCHWLRKSCPVPEWREVKGGFGAALCPGGATGFSPGLKPGLKPWAKFFSPFGFGAAVSHHRPQGKATHSLGTPSQIGNGSQELTHGNPKVRSGRILLALLLSVCFGN